jgi:cob(I)alamin adenosyltransferase
MSNKVYTKKGDDGSTSLLSGRRISKTMPEIKSVGVLDELNSFIGLLRSEIHNSNDFLEDVQWNLFNAGSIIINDNDTQLPEINEDDVTKLEKLMDEMNSELPPLKNFILPKGSKAVSTAHICRTLARRAEIQVLECKVLDNFIKLHPISKYLNRLSDYFFVYARYLANKENIGETIWKN